MPPKRNPLNLNALQLKTLTLLQELARIAGKPAASDPETETESAAAGIAITELPHAHGDHFHLGEAVVASRDATGLRNPSVWAALERKGLIRPRLPEAVILTPLGQEYETGLRDTILHRASH
jgi:hypothetical protein